jgi:hypothetical protein
MARRLVLLVAPALLAGCGPTSREAGQAILGAAPVFVAAGPGILSLLFLCWQGARPEVTMRRRPNVVPLGIALGASVVVIVAAPDAREWIVPAMQLAGTSYLTLLLVTWRIWMFKEPRGAFAWSWVPAFALIWLSAAVMAVVPDHPYDDGIVYFVWVMPGWGGLVAGPLLVVLLVEALVRRRLARRPRY